MIDICGANLTAPQEEAIYMRFQISNGLRLQLTEADMAQLSAPEKIQSAIDSGTVIAYDIFESENLVGFAMLRPYEDNGYFLWDFAIDCRYQNQHKGTRALKGLLQMMRSTYNAREISVTYLWGNDRARRVYENIGFRQTDVVDEPGIHEVNMLYVYK